MKRGNSSPGHALLYGEMVDFVRDSNFVQHSTVVQ